MFTRLKINLHIQCTNEKTRLSLTPLFTFFLFSFLKREIGEIRERDKGGSRFAPSYTYTHIPVKILTPHTSCLLYNYLPTSTHA